MNDVLEEKLRKIVELYFQGYSVSEAMKIIRMKAIKE